MKNKLLSIIQWLFVAIILLCAVAIKFSFGTVLLVISAILLAPIKPIRKFLKEKLKIKSIVAVVLSMVIFFVGIMVSPQSEIQEQTDSEQNGTGIVQNDEDETDLIDNNNSVNFVEPANTSVQGELTTEVVIESGFTPSSAKTEYKSNTEIKKGSENIASVSNSTTPKYESKAYVTVNNNVPKFTATQKATKKSFETYSNLDSLGRCGVAFACIGKDIMPTQPRGSIGQVKPSGWHTVKYDCVDGKYLYNRCHLIGYQLSGENANVKNLITGTRYLNLDGMLPFENMVADYIKETGNHVLYRVTPVFKDKELVARGVQIEAYSVEDKGEGICFNVYCFNVQPGVDIVYLTGDSALNGEEITTTTTTKPTTTTTTKKTTTTTKPTTTTTKKTTTTTKQTTTKNDSSTVYVLNTNTLVFHRASCRHVKSILPENREDSGDNRNEIIAIGYKACGTCKP